MRWSKIIMTQCNLCYGREYRKKTVKSLSETCEKANKGEISYVRTMHQRGFYVVS